MYQENLNTFLEIANRFKLDGLIDQFKDNTEEYDIEETLHYTTKEINSTKASTPIQEDMCKKMEMDMKTISTYESLMISDTFENMDEVNQTIAENMNKGPDGMWVCSKCPKVSKKKDHMTEHVETHIEGLSFQCPNCDKSFRCRKSLRQHKCRINF